MTLRGTATPAQAATLTAALDRTLTALDALAAAEEVMGKGLNDALKVFPMEFQQEGGPFWNVAELKDGDPQGDLWGAIRKLREVVQKARDEAKRAAHQATPAVPVQRRRKA